MALASPIYQRQAQCSKVRMVYGKFFQGIHVDSVGLTQSNHILLDGPYFSLARVNPSEEDRGNDAFMNQTPCGPC